MYLSSSTRPLFANRIAHAIAGAIALHSSLLEADLMLDITPVKRLTLVQNAGNSSSESINSVHLQIWTWYLPRPERARPELAESTVYDSGIDMLGLSRRSTVTTSTKWPTLDSGRWAKNKMTLVLTDGSFDHLVIPRECPNFRFSDNKCPNATQSFC